MSRLKLLLVALAVITLAGFIVLELQRELSTPEQRIRWALEDAIDQFNARQADRVARLFAGEFVDEGGYDREDVRQGLRVMLWSGGHDFEVELREDQLQIEPDEDGERADVRVGLAFWRDEERDGGPWWDLSAVADFERKGSQWKIVRSRGVNHDQRGE